GGAVRLAQPRSLGLPARALRALRCHLQLPQASVTTPMTHPIFHMVAGAPDPVAPFSHAVEADGWIFVTGQMPFAGTSNTSAYPDTIEDQTRQVMKNLITVLEGCRLGLADVVAVRIFLLYFDDDYARMNAVYA